MKSMFSAKENKIEDKKYIITFYYFEIIWGLLVSCTVLDFIQQKSSFTHPLM